MSRKSLISLKDVKKKYSKEIFDNLSIDFYEGITLLAGPNGAGKSTLLKMIVGLENIQQGNITLLGINPQKDIHKSLKKKIGVQLQNDNFLKGIKVKEYIKLFQLLYFVETESYSIDRIKTLLNIEELYEKYAFTLSGGEKKRFSLYLSIIGNKKLIILDEPTAGIDIEVKVSILNVLKYLREMGVNIIVSSHDIEEFIDISDDILIINRGLKYQGSFNHLKNEIFINKYKVKITNDNKYLLNKFTAYNLFGEDYFIVNDSDDMFYNEEKEKLTIKDYYHFLSSMEGLSNEF
ncbi:ATP-binding cassette domain-containing protein [Macrococcus capreoli]|uniref:ATP-binding cassette domain-containing protein n=1 Tax=Macrococcus capreoli TaxID=2982690 RepID=UPI0021D58EEB|nr:ABC transporter ATP-binding protein [Macrococcus sp. TMW 2.2395]MCU7558626.1 ABC transporter ATP-binding protein [Macrococcus sp. TMW 2.2395]